MIYSRRKKAVMLLATVLIMILGVRFCVATLNAEIVADKSYAIAVDGTDIDLDGTNNVVVYLKYTNSPSCFTTSEFELTFFPTHYIIVLQKVCLFLTVQDF